MKPWLFAKDIWKSWNPWRWYAKELRETLQESNNVQHHCCFSPYQLPTALVESEIPRLRSGTPCRGIATIAFFGHVADGNSPISGSVVKLSEIAAKTWGNDLVTRSPFQTLEAWQSVNFQAKHSCRQQGWLANQVWDDADILPALIHVEMVRAALVLVCVSSTLTINELLRTSGNPTFATMCNRITAKYVRFFHFHSICMLPGDARGIYCHTMPEPNIRKSNTMQQSGNASKSEVIVPSRF